jgi:hypothetical protein
MAECGTCGFENDPGSTHCKLCHTPLEVSLNQPSDDYTHRVPTGVGIKRPSSQAGRKRTDLGVAGHALTDGERRSDRGAQSSKPGTDLGEKAANSAASWSRDDETTRDYRRVAPRAGAISDLGERAVDVATATGSLRSVRPNDSTNDENSLLGNVKLVVEQGRIIGEQYLLSEPEMVIGRADTRNQSYPDIDLGGQDNEYVHRVHARLQFHDLSTRLSIEHLGGSNPTLVNNRPVDPGELVELRLGDRLRVGRVVMRVTPI